MANKNKVKNKWLGVKVKPEYNSGEVITKPNQSQSIRDILFKNSVGMTYDNYKTPYYEAQATFSTTPMNQIQDMEPVEKLQFLKQVQGQVKDLHAQIKADEKAKAEALQAQQAQAQEVANPVKTNSEAE